MSESLKATFDRATISVMLNHGPGATHLGVNATRMKADITEQQKRRLFMQMEERFKAWTGESFIGFVTRQGARTALAARAATAREGA